MAPNSVYRPSMNSSKPACFISSVVDQTAFGLATEQSVPSIEYAGGSGNKAVSSEIGVGLIQTAPHSLQRSTTVFPSLQVRNPSGPELAHRARFLKVIHCPSH